MLHVLLLVFNAHLINIDLHNNPKWLILLIRWSSVETPLPYGILIYIIATSMVLANNHKNQVFFFCYTKVVIQITIAYSWRRDHKETMLLHARFNIYKYKIFYHIDTNEYITYLLMPTVSPIT